MILHRLGVALIASVVATSAAVAQQSPAPATAAPAAAPKHGCTKPGDHPGNLASENQRRAWQKEYIAYTECMKKFISDQKALAEPYVKAYNSAVDEYNDAVKTFNEQVEKAKRP